MRLSQTIPALPVHDAAAAVAFYRDRLGFEVLHHDGGFAVLSRDEAVLHDNNLISFFEWTRQ